MFKLLQAVFYVQISPDRLVVRNVNTGESIAEVPEVALSLGSKRRLLAVGLNARVVAAEQAAELVNPFAHPRTLVSDFSTADLLLKHQVRKLQGKSFFAPLPRIVIHPMGSPDGGFTQVERRAFRELAMGAGATRVNVWSGRALSDQEVLAGQAPQADGMWE